MSQTIAVKHNIEVAHRLFELPGKCEQIHGHSMWVIMHLEGRVNNHGILGGIEYGNLKRVFRQYLDEEYDHRLLLNASDPFSRPLMTVTAIKELADANTFQTTIDRTQLFLPGLQSTPGDPTTENLAKWIGRAMRERLEEDLMTKDLTGMKVEVWETSVNMASYEVAL